MKDSENTVLPYVLSELLIIAVDESEAAVAAGHTLDMAIWLIRDDSGKCAVCMAGAVMLNRDMLPEGIDVGLLKHTKHSRHQLSAIDEMRAGRFGHAAVSLRLDLSSDAMIAALEAASDKALQHYSNATGHAPFEIYREVAEELKNVGL